ncbi:AtpZ/AtpI family protein [Mucilaginibacter sp. UR6-11]|uniref:AtpZ/AtpI family protein n=1 Tax=Mucilaginibacter sp. UR6-11 TaxID=1435644 RepID=UPI001E481EB6|nr:AtpZ/AtpI family protein [Mucilaginibacter sp. UR6-11]MCC8425128.1 AtpZ/AtpI family protein [Mucilaginibacter sp. UR6-11]
MQENESNNDKETSALAKFTGIAFQMVAVIGVFAFAGYKIDEATGHQTKWVTAILSLIGVFISLYMVIKSLKS